MAEGAGGGGEAPFVLVVDDDRANAHLLERLLETHGMRVVTAASGSEAQGRLTPDLDAILTDSIMPDADGLSVIEAARAKVPDVPAIIMTAHGTVEGAIEALNRGAHGYLLKPFQAQEVAAAVQRAVASRRLVREHRAALEELRFAKNFFESVLRSVPSGLLTVDRELEVTFANPEAQRIFGVKAEAAALGPVASGPFAALAPMLARAAELGEEIPRQELEMQLGERRVVVGASTSPVRDRLGLGAGAIAVMRDLSEVKSLEANLIHAERLSAMGQLTAGIAHEINNPLTAIIGYAQLGAMEMERLEPDVAPGFESLRTFFTKINDAGTRCRAMTSNLLQFSRKTTTTTSDEDLNRICRGTLDFAEYIIRKSQCEARLVLAPDLPHVRADGAQMQQVILNLVINAVHAMQPGGVATVSTRAAGPLVEVSVADTGCGIPADKLEKVFEPFYTTKPQGTGLGLHVCRKIVEAHGGLIQVESTLGVGTRFTVSIPVYRAQQAQPTAAGEGQGKA